MGLEMHLTESGIRRTLARRHAVRRIVLAEQSRQRGLGVVDVDEMARVAGVVSEVSTRRARVIGLTHLSDERNVIGLMQLSDERNGNSI